jgi:hypothetical protein
MIQCVEGTPAEWRRVLAAITPRWQAWLAAPQKLDGGSLHFGVGKKLDQDGAPANIIEYVQE